LPTIRSKFNIDQFERVLQKWAHGLPKFHRVSTDDTTINFYYDEDGKPRRISVQFHARTGKMKRWGSEIEYWSFTIEPKLYTTSDDSSKIIPGYSGQEEKIMKFIEKVMAAEKVIPRFTLSQRKP
jgi:hypothetical protein